MDHSTLKTEKLLSSSPSQKSALTGVLCGGSAPESASESAAGNQGALEGAPELA